MPLLFLDFEASALAGGFPIEVAWLAESGQGESYLIRPAPAWLKAKEWSEESRRIHGISMEELMDRGVPHVTAAKRARAVLGAPGAVPVCDAPDFDGGWLAGLLEAGCPGERIAVGDVDDAYAAACRPLLRLLPPPENPGRRAAEARMLGMARLAVSRAAEAEARRPRVTHRALPDAEGLWRTWRGVGVNVAAALAAEAGKASGVTASGKPAAGRT